MKYFILLVLTTLSFAVAASESSYETQLIKLSKALKGEPASLQDRAELKLAIANGTAELFLQQKTLTYMTDPKFSLKLKQKVDELLRFKPQTAELTPANNPFFPQDGMPTAYDIFVRNLILKNASWNELLTGKTYQTYGGGSFLLPEKAFYNFLDPKFDEFDQSDLFPIRGGTVDLTTYAFAKEDSRLAGILTTPRFFGRYVNTALNKNRRRASAVFRVFLCDNMIPTVPTQDSNSEKTDYDTILPDHTGVTEEQLNRVMNGDVHGTQADCMSCHYKLDPLGRTFGLSAATVSSHPTPGALRFAGYDGRKVDVSVAGIGELGEQITQQPEFAKCQVGHFWRWYIGKDVPLSTLREQTLVTEFDRVGRRPQDFVAYLVRQPEFKEKPQILTEDQLLSRRVVKVFKSCNSCHSSQDIPVWDLTDLPYGTDPARIAKRLKLLSKVMDLDHDGMNAEMPPKDSLWRPSQDEVGSIKKWMSRGAPDFNGKPQVPAGSVL